VSKVSLGFRAIKGGAITVAVEGREPRVVLSTFLATAAKGDRLSLEPYLVASEMKRDPGGAASPGAKAAVAEGRKRQDQLAVNGLHELVRQLKGHEVVNAALLVNRAGWITDLLEYSLGWAEHVPVAEGLAVREALRFAFRRQRLQFSEVDEKSLHETATKAFNLSKVDIDSLLKRMGVAAGKPWRKEQKLAFLAAWLQTIPTNP
jgi:hypothetical protein